MDQISDFHVLKTSLALVHGIALKRWPSGLCVMLEKTPGVRLITKLGAILLMEADFNIANKIVFGERMMTQLENTASCRRKYLARNTENPPVMAWQKYSSTTPSNSSASQPGLTPPIATTV